MSNLEWKDIVGYEGAYKVSSNGDIYSMVSHKIRKTFFDKSGYPTVKLYKNGSGKNYSVHRLVAEAFIERKLGKNYVNHKDGDKTNNAVDNLEWCTPSENVKHAYAKLGKKVGKALMDICIATRKKVVRDDGVVYESIRKAAMENGTTTASLSQMIRLYPLNKKNGHTFAFYKEGE